VEASINPIELLQYYIDIGADEFIEDNSIDRFEVTEILAKSTASKISPLANLKEIKTIGQSSDKSPIIGTIQAIEEAKKIAAKANTIDELKTALQNFKGISLSRTATQMVFAEGIIESKIMIIGDTPNADEDRAGRPFIGDRGELLDKMFAAIGLNREKNIYISNLINWYPPGNRIPSAGEIALCLPFLERHIELAQPKIIILIGDIPTKALLQTKQSITRIHGKWQNYNLENLKEPIYSIAIFRPDYLLASPAQKGKAWVDLLKIKDKIKELGIG